VGHARTYVTLDFLRRATASLTGRSVEFALGVTDIDDKICARAVAGGETPHTVARRFEAAFLAELAQLGCAPPTALTRVSEHIPEVLAYISRLLGNGSAYVVAAARGGGGGASVYLSVPALGGAYGKLAPAAVRACAGAAGGADEGAEAAARGKRDPRDFALWKGVDGGELGGTAAALAGGWAWDSPWGLGRPGWHIECSAMTRALFGGALDVHAGGADLRFPHHCNELAQADAWEGPAAVAGGYAWVGAWLHTGHVRVAGLKMSKSLKNFTPVAEVLAPGGEAEGAVRAAGLRGRGAVGDAFRMWCLAHHYSAALSYAPARLGDAAVTGRRMDAFLEAAMAPLSAGAGMKKWTPAERALADAWGAAAEGWDAALRDDFDTPRALRVAGDAAAAGAAYLRGGGAHAGLLASVAGGLASRLESLGVRFAARRRSALDGWCGDEIEAAREGREPPQQLQQQPSAELVALVQQREAMRSLAVGVKATAPQVAASLLAQCDAIRDKVLPGLGWTLKDAGPQGPTLLPR
jgi:cysteinyl-tRNA synthetase